MLKFYEFIGITQSVPKDNIDKDLSTFLLLFKKYSPINDFRAIGICAENILKSVYDNLEISRDRNYDIQNTDNGHIYEVKTITNKGVDLLKSNMKGVGRKFRQEEYIKWLEKMSGFILVKFCFEEGKIYTRFISSEEVYENNLKSFSNKECSKFCL